MKWKNIALFTRFNLFIGGSCTTQSGCISEPQYYSGTLISNRYIVTAAEIFDDDRPNYKKEKKLKYRWNVATDVEDVGDISRLDKSDRDKFNKKIIEIYIHPLNPLHCEFTNCPLQPGHPQR